MDLKEKKLFSWQEECLERFIENEGRGIVNVVTGAGKTILALGAVLRLTQNQELMGDRDLKIKIIVPKTFLVHQWAKAIKAELPVIGNEIGYYYGKHKEKTSKKYMLYVINSARYALSRHIMEDMEHGSSVFLIADECHHYGSEENFRIFEFFPYLIGYQGRFFSLGLSATPEPPPSGHSLEPYLGKEIYKYGFESALQSKIISEFSIFRIGVDFTEEECEEYDLFSKRILAAKLKLKKLCPGIWQLERGQFFARLQRLASDDNPQIAACARAFLNASYGRQKVVLFAEARIACVCELIERLSETSKIIVFGERIEMADILYAQLKERYAGQVGRYHSELSEQEKKNALYRYQNSEIRILISCRALDEGLNIPETDVGIILSETSVLRQRIQRLGRILRKTTDGHAASLYSLFVNQANESDSDLGELSKFDLFELFYDSAENEFISAAYEQLCRRVRRYLRLRHVEQAVLSEVEKNLRRGIVHSDYCLKKEACRERITAAASKDEKNYWVTMLLMAKVK